MLDKKQLAQAYFQMPEAQLLGILDRQFKEALNIELIIVDDWIKNKKCKCVEDNLIQSKKVSLNCKHLNKELEKPLKDINKSIEFLSNILKIRKLNDNNIPFLSFQVGGN